MRLSQALLTYYLQFLHVSFCNLKSPLLHIFRPFSSPVTFKCYIHAKIENKARLPSGEIKYTHIYALYYHLCLLFVCLNIMHSVRVQILMKVNSRMNKGGSQSLNRNLNTILPVSLIFLEHRSEKAQWVIYGVSSIH